MPYTSSQLEAIILTLETGLASGYASIAVEGRGNVTYRNQADILKAIDYFNGLLGEVTNTSPRRRITRIITDKGF